MHALITVSIKSLILSTLIFLAIPSHSLELQPRNIHNKSQLAEQDMPADMLRLVIKFHDGTGIRSGRSGALEIHQDLQNTRKLRARRLNDRDIPSDVNRINQLLSEHGLEISSMIQASERMIQRQVAIAESYWNQELAELQTYQQILLNNRAGEVNLPTLIRLFNRFKSIEIVYPEPIAFPMATDKYATPVEPWGSCLGTPIDPNAGDLSTYQGYLSTPPTGINANDLHQFPGGKGSDIRVIDIEGGYLPHSDHKKLFQKIGHTHEHHIEHGNAVVGIISAKDNGIGLKGVAPDVSIGFRGIYNENIFDDWGTALYSSANVAHHIFWAAKHSLQGVVLLELQRYSAQDSDCPCGDNNSCQYTPVEYWPAEFDTIKVAVGNGAVVVEAAGNGSRSLDNSIFNTCDGGCFDRDIRDSGAILVSGSWDDGLSPMCGFNKANYGSRIDTHSWAKNIPTTARLGAVIYDPGHYCNQYGSDFGGTSGASAIIAGGVAALQGAFLAEKGYRLDPLSLREALAVTGTPQIPTNVGNHDIDIGSHPDLTAALAYALESF